MLHGLLEKTHNLAETHVEWLKKKLWWVEIIGVEFEQVESYYL